MSSPSTPDQSLADFLRSLRRHRTLIIAVVLVATVAGLGYSLIKSPTYKATASIQFESPDDVLDRVGSIVSPSFTPDKVAAANIGTVTAPRTLRVAMKSLEAQGIQVGLRPLRDRIKAELNPDNNLIEVNAEAGTGPLAITLANTVADADAQVQNEIVKAQYAQQADSLEEELAVVQNSWGGKSKTARELQLQGDIGRLRSAAKIASIARVVERAAGEMSPVSPVPIRDTALAAFLGLLLGIGAALVRESLDRRLHTTADIQEQLDLPVVGLVRDSAMGSTMFSPNGSKKLSEMDVDSYRILRNNLAFLDVDHPLRSILVTSALSEEGKSTVAASLAQASAAAGIRTLLIECDLRRPSLPKRLGIHPEPGLTDYLVRQYDLKEVLQEVAADAEPFPGSEELPALVCVTAGSPSPWPAETLGSDRFKSFLAAMTEQYDFVIVDTSPLLSVVDTRELVPLVDGVLLCVRASRTTADQMTAAKEALELFPPRPTGVVITGVRERDEPDYGYYSIYHQ
jgi:capsular exopolysaccharide synthesis family protein